MKIEALPIERDKLGESPVWDERIQALYWADQLGKRLRRFTPASGEVREWALPRELGCVALTDDANIMLVAQPDSYVLLDLGNGEVETFLTLPQPRPGVRLNDGRCDRSGRLIAGSVTTDGGAAAGRIWRITPDAKAQLLRDDMVIVNAVCCTPAGDRIYYVDSRGGVIYTRTYERDGDAIGAEEEFVDIRPIGGVADGATVDAEGGLWVAQIMGGRILRFAPDGTLDRTIDMPSPHISSVTFGGTAFDTLYATTVRETGMLITSDHPGAGQIFAITGLGVSGVAEGKFAIGER